MLGSLEKVGAEHISCHHLQGRGLSLSVAGQRRSATCQPELRPSTEDEEEMAVSRMNIKTEKRQQHDAFEGTDQRLRR